MPYVSKKKLKELFLKSFIMEVIKDKLKDDAEIYNSSPENWSDEDKLIFDISTEIEHKWIESIKNILEKKGT